MKKALLFLTFLVFGLIAISQTTYYWIGGTGTPTSVSFTTDSKWNTALNGSGTPRTASSPTDVLIVDGTNVGGATPTTGAVVASISSNTFGQLILQNNASLTLLRPTTGNGTVTINGDGTAAEDLVVNSGCTLTVGVADSVATTSGNNLLLSSTATGRIFGTVNLSRGSCRMTAANAVSGGALFFESGSVCNTNTQTTYYPFGSASSSNPGANNAIVFKSGSKLVYAGGNCPFSSTSTYVPVVFQSGSTFRIQTSVPDVTVTSSNLFAGRTFANVEIGSNASVTGDFFYNIDNLTIDAGSSFYLKTSGASPVSGNIVNNGTFGSATGFTSSVLLMKGTTAQSIGGTGTFVPLGALSVAADADVTLGANLVVNSSTNSLINGRINFQTKTLSGSGTFQTKAQLPITTSVTSAVAGSYDIVLDAAAYNASTNNAGVYYGIKVIGTGVPPNTYIIGTTSSSSTITVSNPLTAVPTSVTLVGNVPVVRTSNTNGIDGSLGSMALQSFTTSTDFVFDGPTTNPFSTTSLGSVRNVTFNASATTNRTILIDSVLTINSGILSIRPTDTVRIKNGKDIAGAPFSSAKHIATLSDATNSGQLRIDLVNGEKLFPLGSALHYLPAIITPNISSVLYASVYEGITQNGSLSGTPLDATELSKVVNTMWKIDRTTGSGDMTLKLGWDASLEGSTFAGEPNANIGMIQNNGTSWGVPFGSADNATNIAQGTINSLGTFSVGSTSSVISPFIFNPISPRTYGDADFSAGASSLNTTQPIVYNSSDLSVATISSTGIIHIVGAGTTNITASQATDGNYPAANITQSLTVDKAALTIGVQDATRPEGTPNPEFTLTFYGFVLGETAANLLQQATVATDATQSSPAGVYVLQPSGASSNNYDITYTNGSLTILAADSSYQMMTVYNSSPGVITVKLFSPSPDLGYIILYDLQGKLITKKNIMVIEGTSISEIKLPAIANACYAVTFVGKKNKMTKLLFTGR